MSDKADNELQHLKAEIEKLKAEIEKLKADGANAFGRALALEAGLVTVLRTWGQAQPDVQRALEIALDTCANAANQQGAKRELSAGIAVVGEDLMEAISEAAKNLP
ncbi:hypothetical protein [Stenotrophomonas maltophilia]|uniref:hypothetical protein n=1 Tax=Stenotrophomonas maltophilia TaxID=40324 RepID=UPI002B1D000C|nr:hypothetical protein [Stenotrophomonas maltophilia]